MFDGKAFGLEIVGAVKAHMVSALAPITARLDALEKQVAAIPAPAPPMDIALVERAFKAELVADIAALRTEVRGLVPDVPAVVAPMIDDAFKDYAAANPRPPMVDEVVLEARVTAKATRLVQDLRAAVSGEIQAAHESIKAVRDSVPAEVASAVAALPPPEPGNSVTVDDVRPVIEEAVQRAVAALPAAQDGCGIAELLIDRDGQLVATMDDGRVKMLGPVVGKDGTDADMAAIERSIAEKVAAIPAPLDGVGFDDMVCEVREDGTYLVFVKGDVIKELRLPIPMDKGVWKEGTTYKAGDGVSWAGSFWIAAENTTAKPDTSKDGKPWRMAVRRGRDGKDKD